MCRYLGSTSHVATVLTACGIETIKIAFNSISFYSVATVLTACGIETLDDRYLLPEMVNQLQQCLPLAVLKLTTFICLN